MIGALLNQRYRLDSELGQGGMGTVYRGYDLLLEREVAVKLLSKTNLGTEGRSRLLNEARAVARLNHPNIVNLHDAGEADVPSDDGISLVKTPYIVMELVEGTNLHDQPPKSMPETVAIARQVCAALEHAHAHGIIHRDLKPENIVIASDGRARLMDFGLARSLVSRLSTEGTIIGTVFYQAPEQILGQAVDHRADLYALGVMLYEMTTGRLPFTGDEPLAVVSQHLYAPLVPPRAHNPAISPALDDLIVRLMAKQPDDRPASAAEVSQALDTLESPTVAPFPERLALERIARGKLVSRERELAEMNALWRRVAAGEGEERVLLVSGEPGIGKSRLVRELMTMAQVTGARVLNGECYAEASIPYAPVAQIIRQALSILEANGQKGGLPKTILAELITLAPDLRSRYPDTPANPPLEPLAEQQRVCESLFALCVAIAEAAPAMLVIDDVHWADSGTLGLLRYLARRSRNSRTPLLIVAAYREIELDEARPWHEVLLDLNRERLATRLKLGRLNRDQTRNLLAALFEEEITPEFLDGIYQETEGNPFFVEEVCKTLIEEGKVYFENGRWHRPPMDEIVIPQSVRIAIQTRLARLPTHAQETMRLAAILGREFDFQSLRQASELDEEALVEALEIAGHAQFIDEAHPQQPGEVRFAFVHALIPATLRESLGGLRRQRLHRRVASAIQTLRPEDYEALAEHYQQAGELERARFYNAKAGDHALGVYANQEAERYYHTALELGGSETERLHLFCGLGEALYRQSRSQEAQEAWLAAVPLCRSLKDYSSLAEAYANAALAARQKGDLPACVALCHEGLAAIAGQPESLGQVKLLRVTAITDYVSGLTEESLTLTRQAFEIAERLGAVEEQARLLTNYGYDLMAQNQDEEAAKVLTRAIELTESNRLFAAAEIAHNYLGQLIQGRWGDFKASRQHFLRALELSRLMGLATRELFNLASVMYTNLFLGDLKASREMRESLEQLRCATENVGPAWHVASLSLAYLDCFQGNGSEAVSYAQETQKQARLQGDFNYLNISSLVLGEISIEAGDWEKAEKALLEAVEADNRLFTSDANSRCLLAQVRAHQGRLDEAHDLLTEAERIAGSQPRFEQLAYLGVARSSLAVAEQRWEDAWLAFETTMHLLDEKGIRWQETFLLRRWAQTHLQRNLPGDRQRASQLLSRALELNEAMQNPKYVALIRAELQALV